MTGQLGADMTRAPAPVDVHDLTALLTALAERLGWQDVTLRQADIPGLHPGRGAEVLKGDDVIGTLGELHPTAAGQFGLTQRVAVAELAVDPLLAEPPWWAFSEPSIYPPQKFDLAFEMEDSVPAAALVRSVTAALGAELESARIFDEFDLGGGRKSLAVTIVIRAADHTMTDEEAQHRRRAVIEHVQSELDLKLRGGA
jgi:phenylalanyl-tRNA synthetase beta chain